MYSITYEKYFHSVKMNQCGKKKCGKCLTGYFIFDAKIYN